MSSHIIYSFELLVLNKVNLRGCIIDELVIILKKLVADRILQYIRVKRV